MGKHDLSRCLDEALAEGIVEAGLAGYKEISKGLEGLPPEQRSERLVERLTDLWLADYEQDTVGEREVVELSDGAYRYLFDLAHERVVAAWGQSQRAETERDSSRQSGFLPGFTKHYSGKDRGHFMSHGQGGLMDVNFFPQDHTVNRGWSPAGKLYRRMEKYCAETPGTFCFSRPLYDSDNPTWDPDRLEYGVFLAKGGLRAVVFPN